jgi:hypothetical protein
MFLSILASSVATADYPSSGGVPPEVVFGFAFLMIMIAIAGISIRSGRANRELARLRSDTAIQQRESGADRATVDSRRQAAVAEAIRREPALRDASHPESLRRLNVLVEEIEGELRLKADLDRVRRAEDEQARSRARTLDEERKAAEKKARIDAMPPAKRWVWRHRDLSVLALAALVAVLVFGWTPAWSAVEDARARSVAAEQLEARQAAAVQKAAEDKVELEKARKKAAAEKVAAAEERAAAEKAAAEALMARRAACAAGSCLVGDPGPGGGIVFYAADSLQSWGRYLEVAPAGWAGGDEDPKRIWCGNVIDIADTRTGVGTGKSNTKRIAAACPGSPAGTALEYAGGGKSDWFLPSKDELNLLVAQRASVGGLARSTYWSSSHEDASDVWAQNLVEDGRQLLGGGDRVSFFFRPVRAF